MPTASDEKDRGTIVATKVDVSQSAVVSNGEAAADMSLPLPVQVIERNRLTLAEILTLPRFRDYRPGEPSKVRDSLRDLSLAVGEVASFPASSFNCCSIQKHCCSIQKHCCSIQKHCCSIQKHCCSIPRLGIPQAIENWKWGWPGNET